MTKVSSLPDSFFVMFRRDRITPYTNFASSSNGSEVRLAEDTGGAMAGVGGTDSELAIMIPDDIVSVFLGLVISVEGVT